MAEEPEVNQADQGSLSTKSKTRAERRRLKQEAYRLIHAPPASKIPPDKSISNERTNDSVPTPPNAKEDGSKVSGGDPLLSKKPIDRWLQLLGIAVGVAFVMLPKTPWVIVACLFIIFALLIHPTWNLWWIEKTLLRRLLSSVILVLSLVMFGYLVWPTYYFPWLATSGTTVDRGVTTGMMIRFIVRDKNRIRSGSPLPSQPLHNVRLTFTTPIGRNGELAWNECTLATKQLAVWSNQDISQMYFGVFYFRCDTTLLHARISDDNGDWELVLVTKVVNGKLETRERLDGRLFQDNGKVLIDEATDGFPQSELTIPLKWGPQLFSHYGIEPTIDGQVDLVCRALALRP